MWYKVTFEDEKEYKKIKCVLMYATYPNHLLEQIKLLLQWLSMPHLISVEEVEEENKSDF